jgi:tRNA threonylcarbamoyladenosine biosynthesis protein TsaB
VDGLTLVMDAAAGSGTLALLRGTALIAERTVVMRSEAEERFLPAVIALLDDAKVSLHDCARIVCGGGPGSFTSLRVVGAAAKGLSLGAGIPLHAVPSLALIVAADERTRTPGSRWLATLDAMRAERYLALVTIDAEGAIATYESLGLAPVAEIAARAEALEAIPIGPEESHQASPHARGAGRAAALVASGGAVALASWEPVYGRLAEAQVKWEAAQGRPLG